MSDSIRVEAERNTGKIVSLVYSPTGIEPKPPDHYARVALQEATLEAGHGITTDRKGGRPDRHLNVMSHETLEELRARGYRTAPGEMGEQIIVSGMIVDRLASGTRLRLGDEVLIEVIRPRTGCDRLRQVQGCTPAEVAGRLGVMARIVVGGTIQVGDGVSLCDGGA